MKLTPNQIKYQLKKIKDKKLEECNYRCPNCNSNYFLQLSHIVPKGQNKSLELDEENSLIDCQECHQIWENKGENWSKTFHWIKNFRERFYIIKKLDEDYFNRIFIKMPEWLQVIVQDYIDYNYY